MLHIDHKAWGKLIGLERNHIGGRFIDLSLLEIYPGESITLKSHKHIGAHWIVLAGEASKFKKDDHIYLPQDDEIVVENNGEENLVLLEVRSWTKSMQRS